LIIKIEKQKQMGIKANTGKLGEISKFEVG
jgi:hypothetical protein